MSTLLNTQYFEIRYWLDCTVLISWYMDTGGIMPNTQYFKIRYWVQWKILSSWKSGTTSDTGKQSIFGAGYFFHTEHYQHKYWSAQCAEREKAIKYKQHPRINVHILMFIVPLRQCFSPFAFSFLLGGILLSEYGTFLSVTFDWYAFLSLYYCFFFFCLASLVYITSGFT